MQDVKVISLGGSIIAPDKPDTGFIKDFRTIVEAYLSADSSRQLIFVVGGGGPARQYQQAAKELSPDLSSDNLDWIGIMATRLNSQLVKEVFHKYCLDDVVTDPTADFKFTGKVLLAAGWKPGFSTDNDAVLLAEKFGAKTVINLSNISKIYSDDPKKNPAAIPLDSLTWDEYKKMIGEEWTPGRNVPFDPVATKKAAEMKLRVVSAGGKDLANLKKILEDKPFFGSVIEG